MLIDHAGTASATATALAAATVLAILVLRKVSRRIPGSILVLLVGSGIALAAGGPSRRSARGSAVCQAACLFFKFHDSELT